MSHLSPFFCFPRLWPGEIASGRSRHLLRPPTSLPSRSTSPATLEGQHLQNSGVYNNYYCPRRPSPLPSSPLDASRPSAPLWTAAVAWSPLQPPWTGWSMVHAYPASPASSDVRLPLRASLSPLHPPLRILRTCTRVLCAPSTKKDRRRQREREARERERERERRQLTRRYGEC